MTATNATGRCQKYARFAPRSAAATKVAMTLTPSTATPIQ